MNVRVVLISLTLANAELQVLLPHASPLPSCTASDHDDPDQLAIGLSADLSGSSEHVVRHCFLTAAETGDQGLTLVYRQLLPTDHQIAAERTGYRLQPLTASPPKTVTEEDWSLVERVVTDLRTDLNQVLHSRLNKQGLVHLLQFLPEIFDHKELAAAYFALIGEKPTSPLMLARMMLDKYTVGTGDKVREVQGRNLIVEFDQADPSLRGEKWEKNKDLYRTGGPKAKRLYLQILDKHELATTDEA